MGPSGCAYVLRRIGSAGAGVLAFIAAAPAPLAARATKEVARRAPDMSTVDATRFGEIMLLVTNATQDAAEGRAAAPEHRPPVWRGR